MIHALVPFRELARTGVVPAFRVIRRPIVTQGVEIKVGEVVAPETFTRTRLRQFYESRLIEPVVAPKSSRQQAIEKAAAAAGTSVSLSREVPEAQAQAVVETAAEAEAAAEAVPVLDAIQVPRVDEPAHRVRKHGARKSKAKAVVAKYVPTKR